MKLTKSFAYTIELILYGLLVGCISSVALGYVYGDGVVSLGLGLGISVVTSLIFGVIRQLTNNFGVFFLLHLSVAIIMTLLPSGVAGKAVIGVSMLILIVLSVIQVKKPFAAGNKLHFGATAIFVFCSYAASFMQFSAIEYSCFILTAIFIALYFIRDGVYNTQDFIEHNDNNTAPLKEIRLRSYAMVCGFGAIVGLLMIAVRYMGGQVLVSQIGNIFYAVGSAIARWLIYKLQGSYVEGGDIGQEDNIYGFVKDAFKEREIPPFIEIIERLIRYFFIALIIIGFVALVVWFIIKLYSVFGKDHISKSTDKGEFLVPFIKQKSDRGRGKTKEKSPSNNKVRKYYRKYIIKKASKGQELLSSKTPLEISNYLGIDSDNIDEEIRRIYEKARYSREGCTKEEIKLIKGYLKGRE
ncbi:MAG: hypothetical protein PHE51_07035 [Eubacteriales bacterium]|nr:hypothetical protein [Eubacteriales bacterium]